MPRETETTPEPTEDETTGRVSVCLSVITKRFAFTYRNWRGEVAERTVEPTDVWFGTSPWHEGEQWFLSACDVEKQEMRDFAMKDISNARYIDS